MRNIKRYVAMALLGVTIMSFSGCDVVRKTEEAKGKTVLAEFNGEEITKNEVDRYLVSNIQTYKDQYGDNFEENSDVKDELKKLRENAIDTIIKNKICEMKAKEYKVVPSDKEIDKEIDSQISDMKEAKQYDEYLKKYELTDEEYRDLIKHQIIQYAGKVEIQARDCKEVAEPTESELSEAYTSYVDTSTKLEAGALVSHILFTGDNAEKNCKKAKELADEGKTFEEIAVMKDYRTNSTYQELGHLNFENSGVDAEFESAFKELPENKISEPVKSSFGWHLILNRKINNEAMDASQEYFKPYLQFIVKSTNKQTELTNKVKEYQDAMKKDNKITIYSDRI